MTNSRKQAVYHMIYSMRRITRDLTGVRPPLGITRGDTYDIMASAIRKHEAKAKRLFSSGRPDAGTTEWKFGADRIKDDQFVWDVLHGTRAQIRHTDCTEDFELFFRTGVDRTKLFDSYRDFVVWGFGENFERIKP
jgi:hypothetical protein